ncbi:MAG: AraC family transcriptional regulator [Beijerinckiaceae bacterium]
MSNLAATEQAPPASPRIDPGYRRVGVLTRLPDILAGLGAEPAAVFVAAGLSPADVARQEGSISYVAMGRLFRAAVAATGCQHIGILTGSEANLQTLGLVGRYMAHSPSVGEAMRALVQNYERFGRGSHVYLINHGDHVLWGYAVHQKDMPGVEHAHDFAIAAGFRFLKCLCGEGPAEVLLPRKRPSSALAYHEAFKAPVRFDSEHAALVIPARVLKLPVPGANPAKRADIEASVRAYWAADGGSLSDRVMQTIRRAILAESVPTSATVAEALGLHPKALSRRLQREETSFRALLNEARFQMARQLLECTRMSVTDLALALGYADIAAFNHAFQRWTGASPGEWRKGAPADVQASEEKRVVSNSIRRRPAAARMIPASAARPQRSARSSNSE